MFADTIVEHRGDDAVRIVDVELVEPVGLALEEAALVELRADEPLLGMRHVTPDEQLPEVWEQRNDLEGTDLDPGERWNLALVVRSDAEVTGVAEAVELTYEDASGSAYVQRTLTRMLVTESSCEDTLEEHAG